MQDHKCCNSRQLTTVCVSSLLVQEYSNLGKLWQQQNAGQRRSEASSSCNELSRDPLAAHQTAAAQTPTKPSTYEINSVWGQFRSRCCLSWKPCGIGLTVTSPSCALSPTAAHQYFLSSLHDISCEARPPRRWRFQEGWSDNSCTLTPHL